MFRFFVTERQGDTFTLTPAILHHLRVIRAQREHFICVHDGQFYECELAGDRARITRALEVTHEYDAPVALGLALIEEVNWEWALVKSVELGATHIYPLITARTAPHHAARFAERRARYERKLVAAAEQAFRNVVPVLAAPLTLADALTLPMRYRYLAHEKVTSPVPTHFAPDTLFLVGPEGGFTDEEVALASQAGVASVSLGPRILRAETAALALLAKVVPAF